jgi:hypothetical protein
MRKTMLVLIAAAAAWPTATLAQAYQFYPLTPCRVVDTRHGYGGAISGQLDVDPPLVDRTFTIKGANKDQSSPPVSCGVPTDAKAVSMNVVAVDPKGGVYKDGYFTVYPSDLASRPVVSSLNWKSTDTAIANGAIVPLGAAVSSEVSVHYGCGQTPCAAHLILDVTGYFK